MYFATHQVKRLLMSLDGMQTDGRNGRIKKDGL